jgi:hypothetical protein
MSTPNQRILAAADTAAIGSAAAAWLPSAALEEVVTTAERREASVLRTPIVITAVTGEQLAGASDHHRGPSLHCTRSIGHHEWCLRSH